MDQKDKSSAFLTFRLTCLNIRNYTVNIFQKTKVPRLINADSISFSFSSKERELFDDQQYQYWERTTSDYSTLKKRCVNRISIPQSGSQKDWIASRVTLHTTPSIMRLLYLTESFCESAKSFNSVTCAALLKSMVEVPLHLGYIVWILDSRFDFEKTKKELHKLAFGIRDPKTGLTAMSKISQKDLYVRTDEMLLKFFKDDQRSINIFETLYKESNATGHHNYEARMLCGLQNKDEWSTKERKKQFVFFNSKIFHFSQNCSTIISMSNVFMNAIEHYLEQYPDPSGSNSPRRE